MLLEAGKAANKAIRKPIEQELVLADTSKLQEALDRSDEKIAAARKRIEEIGSETYKPSDYLTQPTNTGGGDSSSVTTDTPSSAPSVSPDISAQHSAGPGKMSKQAIYDMSLEVGFNPEQAKIVTAISGGESGFDPSNSTVRSGLFAKTGEDSVGLMQINWGYHKNNGWSTWALSVSSSSIQRQPRASKWLYDQRGSFDDWSGSRKGTRTTPD